MFSEIGKIWACFGIVKTNLGIFTVTKNKKLLQMSLLSSDSRSFFIPSIFFTFCLSLIPFGNMPFLNRNQFPFVNFSPIWLSNIFSKKCSLERFLFVQRISCIEFFFLLRSWSAIERWILYHRQSLRAHQALEVCFAKR